MKHINKIPFLSLILLLFVAGCKEEENVQLYDGPVLVHFAEPTTTSTSYFVKETADEGFVIPIGVPQATTEDRTIQVSVVADETTAEEGVHYTIPGTVTIPAGQTVGNLVVMGNFANITEPVTLTLRLAEGQDNAAFNQTTAITMRQFCPYVQENFVGTWRFTSTLFEGSWDVELVAGATPNEVIAVGLYEDGSDIVIQLDDSNPANFVAIVAEQDAWVHPTYGQAKVASETPHGTFSACDNTISVVLSFCVSAGCFPDDNTTFTKL